VVVEIDVQPFAAGSSRVVDGYRHKAGANAQVALPRVDQGVQDEGVDPAVPGHVDETNQLVARARGDPTQAVALEPPAPIVVEQSMTEALGVERVELAIVELAAPVVADARQRPIT